MRNSNRCESQDYNTALLTLERRLFFVITFIVVSLLFSRTAFGSDWPTYRRDNQRSGISSESLKLPLKLKWTHKASHPVRHGPRAPHRTTIGTGSRGSVPPIPMTGRFMSSLPEITSITAPPPMMRFIVWMS